jgi:hypothetical protein
MVMGCALSAFAGPQIGVLDPLCLPHEGLFGTANYDFGVTTVNPDGSVTLPGFTPDTNGGGVVTFCNLTTQLWTSADFTLNTTGVTNFDPSTIACGTGTGQVQAFLHCSVTVSTNSVVIHFFGIGGDGDNNFDDWFTGYGILPLHTMQVTLNDSLCLTNCTDGGDWKDVNGAPLVITFDGASNAVQTPEPATLFLLGTGFVSLLRRRKRS